MLNLTNNYNKFVLRKFLLNLTLFEQTLLKKVRGTDQLQTGSAKHFRSPVVHFLCVQLGALSGSWSERSGSALGSVFLPSSLTAGLSPEQQQQASRVQFAFYTKSALFQVLSDRHNSVMSHRLSAQNVEAFTERFSMQHFFKNSSDMFDQRLYSNSHYNEMKCKLNITFLHHDSIYFPFFLFCFLQDAALDNQTLVSPVLGSSVANMSMSNLTENIQFTIRNINPVHVSVHTHITYYLSRQDSHITQMKQIIANISMVRQNKRVLVYYLYKFFSFSFFCSWFAAELRGLLCILGLYSEW